MARPIRWFGRGGFLVTLAACLLVAVPGLASAASGDLDTSFNGTGQQFVDFGGADDYGYAVALQSGRLVVAGITGLGANENLALTRLTANGGLDSTFGNNGFVRTSFGTGFAVARHLAVTPGGKIVVCGFKESNISAPTHFALARYLSTGKLDSTFSGDGKVITPLATDGDSCNSLILR